MNYITHKNFLNQVLVYLLVILVFVFIPISQHIQQLAIAGLFYITYLLVKKFNISLTELGIKKPALIEVKTWSIWTIIMLVIILIIKWFLPNGAFVGLVKNRHDFIYILPTYVLFSAFIQELVFRGYVFVISRSLYPSRVTILFNIIIFTAAHLHYFVQLQSNLIFLSIFAGIFWSILYYRHPNLFLAWISHALVGGLGILLLQQIN